MLSIETPDRHLNHTGPWRLYNADGFVFLPVFDDNGKMYDIRLVRPADQSVGLTADTVEAMKRCHAKNHWTSKAIACPF